MIETQRLVLKEYEYSDVDNYYQLKSNVEVWKYSTFAPYLNEYHSQVAFNRFMEEKRKNQYTFLALFNRDGHTYIGEAGIISFNTIANRCVIGYNILPQFWNKGYATEITNALVKYAFEVLEIERVEALVQKENAASCRVLENAGLLREGVLRHFSKMGDCYKDVCYYAIILEDYHGL